MSLTKTADVLGNNSYAGPAFLRLRQVLAIYPVSRSTWFLGIQHGLRL